jgi:hypothetical protein
VRRFQFRLQGALDWRKTRLEVEESKLQRLNGDLRRIEQAAAALTAERDATDRVALAGASTTAEDLQALSQYHRWVARQEQRLSAERRETGQRQVEQRAAVLEAERHVRLIERLKERRLAAWRAEADREQEAAASDAFLARWRRSGAPDSL